MLYRSRMIAGAAVWLAMLGVPSCLGAQRVNGSVIIVRVTLANTDAPLPGTDVRVQDRVGGEFTDSTGEARLTNVPSGRHTVEARRLGFFPATYLATTNGHDTVTVMLSLGSNAQALATVAIRDTAVHWALSEFEQRRKHRAGHFITRDQIVNEFGTDFDALVARHFGQVRFNNGQVYTAKYGMFSCPLVVYIDGMKSPNGLIEPIDPQRLAGVELYSANEVPVQYKLSDAQGGVRAPQRSVGPKSNPGQLKCGVMLIWTQPP